MRKSTINLSTCIGSGATFSTVFHIHLSALQGTYLLEDLPFPLWMFSLIQLWCQPAALSVISNCFSCCSQFSPRLTEATTERNVVACQRRLGKGGVKKVAWVQPVAEAYVGMCAKYRICLSFPVI